MSKALLIIDMQAIMQQRLDAGRAHVNGATADKVTDLAQAFRAKNLPVIHIRHQDEATDSPLHPTAPGFVAMPCGVAQPGEAVFYKSTSSGFASTQLAEYLGREGITDVITTGAVAGFCVTSTVRAGADLGFNMTVVSDAVLGFDLENSDLSAQQLLDASLALLEADFAKVLPTETVLSQIA